MTVLDMLHNIYSASDGIPHPSAVFAALYALKWNEALATAQAEADALDHPSGDMYAHVLQSTFAREMGWTQAEMEAYLADYRYDKTPEGSQAFEQAYDAYNEMAEHWKNRGGQ